jgi:uncharacterized protein (TIGR03067 family)
MLRGTVLAFVLCLTITADDKKPEAGKKELEKFSGAWKVTLLEMGGKKMPEQQLKAAKLVIDGSNFTMTDGFATYCGHIEVDSTRKPKSIDLIFTEGPEKGKTNQGIYELEGDVFKLCLDISGKARPSDFASKPGSPQVFELLKRVKP